MKQIVEALLAQAFTLLKQSSFIPADVEMDIKVERAKDKKHGDFATNVALLLAKPCENSSYEIAKAIVQILPNHPMVEAVEIAGPGFINFFIRDTVRVQIITEILEQKESFGASDLGKGKKVILEFVSANPTGPLHVGHGRGAAFGASLANILSITGFDVKREYYVNDAGRQMKILAVSVWLRYLELLGEAIVFPSNGYRGDYVRAIAEEVRLKYANRFFKSWKIVAKDLPKDESEGGDKELYIDALIERAFFLLGEEGFTLCHGEALHSVLTDIKEDLSEFGVEFDEWFSEASLLKSLAIKKGIEALKDRGHTYEKEGALWFRAADFGDEKDRVLVRANTNPTYFASDVAYHWNKYERGFERVIDIFGADHHGYLTRIKAAVNALGHDEAAIDILLVQFAILYRGNKRVQMSTRSGSFVTLRELREEVGNDAARFFYVMRKPEQHMDFDLDLAKSESSDNPVYYIQYAHARISSVLRQLEERGLAWDEKLGLKHLDLLKEPHEVDLINTVSRYPEILSISSQACEPHQLAYYLRELATSLHSYYNAIQLLCEQENLRSARMCLLAAVRQVLRNGLALLGVSSPESM